MKQTYLLEGLDCAHCAAKIETAVSKIDGVYAASVNFLTTKMVIEADAENIEAIEAATKKAVRKLEPDVAVRRA